MNAASERRLLIVCPQFAPVSAPDMQRVRISLPHFEEFGWRAHVLAVEPAAASAIDPLLLETIPPSIAIDRVAALPAAVSRLAGVGNIALRALPYLHSAGRRLIDRERIDLVYFSTTMFFSMPLGRVWKAASGTPYVLDFQDPWLSDYYETHPGSAPPPKYGFARRAHAWLEPWTMERVDGVVSVSDAYIDTLRHRYARLANVPSIALPFGGSARDFQLLDSRPQANRHFNRNDGRIHGVYAGRAGDDLAIGLEIVFRALGRGLGSTAGALNDVELHFVGTDYASDDRARKTVEPVAARCGVAGHVHEDTNRAPYFEALQLLRDAHFLLAIGSDDPAYSPSKIYPYILARKPLLAVMHEKSPVVNVIRETKAGHLVTFSSRASETELNAAAEQFLACWRTTLACLEPPDTDWTRFERYSAREMTRKQCALFDEVVQRRKQLAA